MTKIEWTHRSNTKGESWNPLRAENKETGGVGHFCEKVSAGCKNCYAETFQKRFKNPIRYAAQDAEKVEVFLDRKTLLQPLHWKKPRTIFVCSQTDLFLRHYSDEWIGQVYAVMALCPQHTFIILTKRIERVATYIASRLKYIDDTLIRKCINVIPGEALNLSLSNVWVGTSVEDQATADERIPILLETPAAVRFISAEPLLGEISFEGKFIDHPVNAIHENWLDLIDWVIVGGESGHKANPIHPDWVRLLRDQCKATSTPFFFKQWGAWLPWEEDDAPFWKSQNGKYRDGHTLFPDDIDSTSNWDYGLSYVVRGFRHCAFQRVGKSNAGRLLDAVKYDEWPEVKP